MIQKAAAMGHGDWQLPHNNVRMHESCLMQSFLAKHQITLVTQPPYSTDLMPCNFWLFPKLKSPLKEQGFQSVDEIQENTMRPLMATGGTVCSPKLPTLKGLRCHCPMYSVSCILYLLQ